MGSGRYLIFLSYIGRGFNGFQRQGHLPLKTVVSVLEDAIKLLRPANYDAHVVTSSRTDKGVHALCNTVHVDLQHRDDGQFFDPAFITSSLNSAFCDFQEDIRILKTLRVANNFHSRFQTVSRTYVYRISVPQDGSAIPPQYSPFEYDRSYLVRKPIDMHLVQEAANILSGTHDFRAFTTSRRLTEQPWQNPVKTVSVSVEQGGSLLSCYVSKHVNDTQLNYWNLIFKSHSFLFRQVRKMTAMMLSVGYGDLSLDELRSMVHRPATSGKGGTDIAGSEMRIYDCADLRQQHLYNIPPYGLYLTDVEYKECDLMKFTAEDLRHSIIQQHNQECRSSHIQHENIRNLETSKIDNQVLSNFEI